ncbi:MAG: hypothetical protein PVI90_04760, partial [Desulfobacteraceae bacterium]
MKAISCNNCILFNANKIDPWKPKQFRNIVMLIGDVPSIKFPVGGVPFSDRNGNVIKMLLKRLQALYTPRKWLEIQTYMGYLVRCCTDDPLKKDTIELCRTY